MKRKNKTLCEEIRQEAQSKLTLSLILNAVLTAIAAIMIFRKRKEVC